VYDLKRSIYLTSYAVPADGLPRTQTIMYLADPGDHGRLAYLISPDKASVPTLAGGEPQTLHRSILRILAGQPDPEDATHFMIPYVLNGKPGVIDGYIRPDGRVMLEPREGRFLRWSNASNYTWELSSVPTTQPIR
jgi:hypothetical protein